MAYPLTSIIILTKNNVQFTERCLLSIFDHIDPNYTPYEIIILDEGSIDGTKELCELHRQKLQFVEAAHLKSFSSRNNYGVTLAKGKFIWFLNNDTELLNNNLATMLRHFEQDEIAVVGNLHLFPNGNLNHIGIGISQELHPEHIFPNEDPSLPYINHGRYIDIVTAASVVVRKDRFEEVDGFDESYSWGYEDVDFMLKIKEAGYKTYCDADARLVHFGQSTYGRQEEDDKNREIFLEKWQDKLQPNLQELYQERAEYITTKQALPKKILQKGKQVLKEILSAGSKVAIDTPVNFSDIYLFKSPNFSAFRKIADDLGNVIEQDYTSITAINDLSRVDNQNKSAMLLSTTHFFQEYLQSAPAWVRDYRTFDINYERTDYSSGSDYWVESLKNNRMVILASSKYCQDFLLKSGVAAERVHIVPHGYKKEMLNYEFSNEPASTGKISALLIINTNDEVRYGTEYLVEALQILSKQSPDILGRLRLIIKNYGGVPTQPFFMTKEYLDLKKLGVEIQYVSKFLDDEDLAKLYYEADFFIAPFRGEGFGMKIIDAAVAGLPIVSPFYGGPKDYLVHSEHVPIKYKLIPVAQGIDRSSLLTDASYVWAEVDSSDLATQIEYVITNINSLKKAAIAKRDFLRQEYSYQKIWGKILEIDKQLRPKYESQVKAFDFYDTELIYDKATTSHKQLGDIKQSLIINTIHIDNLRNTFKFIEQYSKLEDLQGEILVVDDASDSEPDKLLEEFDHFPLRYIKYGKWGGSGFAREIGLRYAKGDNIIIMGDDIKPMPGFFKGHYDFYLKHPEPYTLVGHVEWDKDIRNHPIAEFTTKVSEFQFGFEVVRNQSEVSYTKVVTPNLSFRKQDIVDLKQHFKVGLILHEDTIWAKELEKKGVQHYYSRKVYALHNHQLKPGFSWLDWFTARSFAMGNNLKAYIENPAEYDEFIYVGPVLKIIAEIYGAKTEAELKLQGELYATIHTKTTELANELINLDQQTGYNSTFRASLYDLFGTLYSLNWISGVVKAINPALTKEIVQGISYEYYLREKKEIFNKFKASIDDSIGLTEATKTFVRKGRNRFPAIFEPLFFVGKKIHRNVIGG